MRPPFAALAMAAASVAPDPRLASAVAEAVQSQLAREGRQAVVTLVSAPRIDAVEGARFEVGAVPGPLPRPRLMVPVTAHGSDGRTVRFQVATELSDRREAWVFTRAMDADEIVQDGAVERRTVDLACCAGAVVTAPPVPGVRTRHAVEAGRPVMTSDLVQAKAVVRGDSIDVHMAQGAVRLAWHATALASADVGDRLMVRAPHGQWRVRVIAPGRAELDEGAR